MKLKQKHCITCAIADTKNRPGLRHIGFRRGKRGVNLMECRDCGRTWKTEDHYVWWPIAFSWAPRLPDGMTWTWVSWHAFQIGWYDLDARLFGQVFHLGRLRLIFGKRASHW